MSKNGTNMPDLSNYKLFYALEVTEVTTGTLIGIAVNLLLGKRTDNV